MDTAISSSFYNEMYLPDGQVRPAYQAVADWLARNGSSKLETLNQQALAMFYRKGVTFTVYSDASNTERVIPFDIIPRIIVQSEWQMLEAGCSQRIRALNAFIHDIYHRRDIVRANIIPAEQILVNDCYEPWMQNLDLPQPIYAHISGIDLVRHGNGEYYVLEDNLRTPSGVSYMLESRLVSERLLEGVLDTERVLPVDNYPQMLYDSLSECSGKDNPYIVVLTPGRYNSAYYEHAFLAREMGAALVHGYDLFVENNYVYVRTVQGKQKVDIVYRRLDDAFLDPLAFRADSILGIPGLMAAYRCGNVMIANAPGTGVADDKSIYPYVGEMIRFYLGEEPILHNVPTWLCRRPDDLAYVLAHLDELVVKETQGSGGYGMLIGPKSTREEQTEYRKRIEAAPQNFIAQPTLALSACPTWVEEGIAPRHIDLRPFVLTSPEKVRLSAGGLTRVALREGSLVVNSSQGGGVKDTWVMCDAAGNRSNKGGLA
ncbi:circularly permuted type 2 ATP-grasp protein [Stenoxybacter acetivorans]|uniref:circularly permuted type 2 ATP-grasp protein n=1 Tax=Stenoxybacter acetivorans TaxID=422441 RepID=UPI000B21F7DC|nr:circularly permuted type 2 ATP-grasp protein [Stenoxybacter acetivorans]